MGFEVISNRKAVIQKHLNKSGCNPAVVGYNILMDVISLAVDHPYENRQELFKRYSEMMGKEQYISWWLNAYNDARYCYITAISPECKGVYRFIKKVAMSVAEEERVEKTYA